MHNRKLKLIAVGMMLCASHLGTVYATSQRNSGQNEKRWQDAIYLEDKARGELSQAQRIMNSYKNTQALSAAMERERLKHREASVNVVVRDDSK